jgi:hypothetical protein
VAATGGTRHRNGATQYPRGQVGRELPGRPVRRGRARRRPQRRCRCVMRRARDGPVSGGPVGTSPSSTGAIASCRAAGTAASGRRCQAQEAARVRFASSHNVAPGPADASSSGCRPAPARADALLRHAPERGFRRRQTLILDAANCPIRFAASLGRAEAPPSGISGAPVTVDQTAGSRVTTPTDLKSSKCAAGGRPASNRPALDGRPVRPERGSDAVPPQRPPAPPSAAHPTHYISKAR